MPCYPLPAHRNVRQIIGPRVGSEDDAITEDRHLTSGGAEASFRCQPSLCTGMLHPAVLVCGANDVGSVTEWH